MLASGVIRGAAVIPGADDGKARSDGLIAGTIPGFRAFGAFGLSNISGLDPWVPESLPVGFVFGLFVVCAMSTDATKAAAIVPPQMKVIICFIHLILLA